VGASRTPGRGGGGAGAEMQNSKKAETAVQLFGKGKHTKTAGIPGKGGSETRELKIKLRGGGRFRGCPGLPETTHKAKSKSIIKGKEKNSGASPIDARVGANS